jgi:ComF family protein
MPGLRAFVNIAIARLFEPPCAACGRPVQHPLAGAVCDACWASIPVLTPPFCEACGDPLPSWRVWSAAEGRCPRCRRTPRAIDRARAAGAYDGALREILHALKYDGRRSVVPRLRTLLLDAGRDLLEDADAVVPVPLHPRREWSRGFNQAALLADGLGPPVVPLLRRVVHTAPQVDLPAARRHRNVRNAFAPRRPVAGALFGSVSSGPRRSSSSPPGAVVLVDDVTTTGATLESCARALKAAGVREVRALTAARVVSTRR